MVARRAGVTCIVWLAMSGCVLPALPAAASDVTGSVAITTDYIYRGTSQTAGKPAAQAGVQFHSADGWNAGMWTSSVDFQNGRGRAYELDLHGGYSWALTPDWAAQIGYVHYGYFDEGNADYDYDEVTASLSYQQRATASIAWSPNTSKYTYWGFISDKRALAYELSVLQPVNPRWSLCAGVGYYDLRDLIDTGYWYWSAGLAFTWQGMQVDLLHIDTDSTGERMFELEGAGSRWTAALTWRF
jgi:uncharacterized protein (TIGR02001 family)